MKLAILSRHPNCYSTMRLMQAAASRGHEVEVLDTLKFSMDLAQGDPRLFYESRRVYDLDSVIPRIGSSITYFGTALVRQFEQMDVFCANSSHGIANSRDKLRAFQIILAENEGIAEAIVETMQSTKQNVLVQKFVAESKGRDIRAFVVGDRVVASMRRVARGNEFRSNVHRGARTEMVNLSEEDQQVAVRAAQIMGLRVAGVDMLESKTGPLIMEVNSSPGLEGIERCTRLDIAGSIIDYVSAQVDFPEIDIRQRLTVSRGYGVTEIHVPEGSEFVGKSIDESGLPEQDINVLTLYRGTTVIPNPRLKRRLEAGDRLLCFGKLESMRSMIPARTIRQRRPEVKGLDSDIGSDRDAA